MEEGYHSGVVLSLFCCACWGRGVEVDGVNCEGGSEARIVIGAISAGFVSG